MENKRVVITGFGGICGAGNTIAEIVDFVEADKSAVVRMPGWENYNGMRSYVGAPAKLINEKNIPRQARRSMGRMSIFAVQAAEEALQNAGVLKSDFHHGRGAVIIGSTMGGAESLNQVFETMLPHHDLNKLTSMQFFQCVSHTAALNVAQYFGANGYVMATSAACASGLQALGEGYNLIRSGDQDLALCGGAEELHPTVTGSFDILYATSANYNDRPCLTPRPFDRDRDGLVCGEGAGILLLESYERAIARGAKIYAEILGYHTCASGLHISQSSKESVARCMGEALRKSNVTKEKIDYVNAHATATAHGDIEEAQAINELLGSQVPVSSLKGYFGHTLGASGAIELILSLNMMEKGMIYPTRNLENIDPQCAGINHITQKTQKEINTILKNCFAFGGINASMVLAKVSL